MNLNRPVLKEFLQSDFFLFVLLFLLGFIAYGQTLSYPFVHDDVVFIEQNPHLGNWREIPTLFLNSSAPQNHPSIVNFYYRPLLEVFYKCEYLFFGRNPWGFHLVNVLLHIANCFLIFRVFLRLKMERMLALGASILFLIHPVQTEAVSCIVGVSNLLFVFLSLASLSCYLLFREKKKKTIQAQGYYAASLAVYAAALFAKEQAVVLPFLLILSEIFHLDSARRKKAAVLALSGFFLVTFFYLGWRMMISPEGFSSFAGDTGELKLRIFSIPKTILNYFFILFVPAGLHYYRSTDIAGPFLWPWAFLLFVLTVGIFAIRKLPQSSRRVAFFGMGWFFITLLPVLHVVPLTIEYSFIMASEHFLYFPLIGFLIVVLVILRHSALFLSEKKRAVVLLSSFLAVCAVFLALTIQQNTFWAGEIPLFKRALLFENHLGRVHILLAKAYDKEGQVEAAVQEYRAALGIIERYERIASNASARNFYLGLMKGIHFDLAHCYEANRDFFKSAEEYTAAIRIDPRDNVLYNNLGINYFQTKRNREAVAVFQTALSLNPDDIMAMNNLALCYISEKKAPQARELLEKALLLSPGFLAARQNLEKLLNDTK